jgi:hypothetical protein
MMTLLLQFLSRKPEIGAFSSLGASMLSVFDNVISWCQLAGILLGIAVGILTVIAKLLEIKKLKKTNKKDKKYD